MKLHRQIIQEVIRDSIADELGLKAGDELLLVNGKSVKDILDYRFQTQDEEIVLLVKKENGEEWELEIEKDFGEDLGLVFEDGLMDDFRSCHNKCVFCFIDQMPPGMRDTLYFKDDDTRLSFLQGNYVTLTNLSKQDIDRICFYKLSPINISVHTTNPKLRCTMLNNRFAGEVLSIMKRFADAGIEMNTQVVLCKGFNDEKELDRTIADLETLIPFVNSCSVVPAGMTKYRDSLAKLTPFSKDEMKKVIHQIELWQQHMLYAHQTRFVYASDEWYLKSDTPLPSYEDYEDFFQLENGVGMVRLLRTEVEEYLLELEKKEKKSQTKKKNSKENFIEKETKLCVQKKLTIATGTLVASEIKALTKLITDQYKQISVSVIPIRNDFFGEEITVAGLLTGQDIIAQLKGKDLGEALLLPQVVLRSGEDVFLDDVTLSELENALQTKVCIVKSSGKSFVDSIIHPFN